MKRKIAIQGIKGSFHDMAANAYFAGDEVELICCDTFDQLIERTAEASDTMALMAIENTIAGSLLHNYELLRDSNLVVCGEYKLHIEHSLLCLPGQTKEDIVEIDSHPVALMQCRNYLKTLPGRKVVEADDTAGSAEMISRLGLKGHAAICSKFAAPIYGLTVLDEAIEDNKHNYTRFLCLCHPEQLQGMEQGRRVDKSSIVFTVPHVKGALSHVLSVMSFYDINMTKIQSLPIIGHEWEYMFYVDATFDDLTRYEQCLEAIKPLTKHFKLLGNYESDKHFQH